MEQALYARQNRRNIVGRRPPVLQNVQTKLPVRVYVWVEHSGQKPDRGRFVWIGFIEREDEFKSSVFERRITYVVAKQGKG